MRRKGLPQASAAVCWSVTGSFPRPAGTQTTLWSVSISDLPGWMDGWRDGGGKKICSTHFYSYAACTPRNLSSQNPSVLDWFAPCFFFFMSGRLAINICCSPA